MLYGWHVSGFSPGSTVGKLKYLHVAYRGRCRINATGFATNASTAHGRWLAHTTSNKIGGQIIMKKIALFSATAVVMCSGLVIAFAGQTKPINFFTVGTTTTGYTKIINDLSTAYAKQNPNVNFKVQTVAQATSDQKLQILAASNDIPTVFNVNTPDLELSMAKAGKLLNMEQTFKSLGIYNKLVPAAVSLEKRELAVPGLYSLPLELNVEGFWFNKKLFQKYHLAVPTTWDQMMQDAKVLKAHGVQPFAVDGKDAWPITRLIGGYIVRYYGADAMRQVKDGKLKMTAPGFIQAAQTVQNMGKLGYLGQGEDAMDYNTARDLFVQDKAAMYYMGSWVLGDFNNPQVDKIGVKNIGYFNIPLVKGGSGNLGTYEMNTGIANGFSKSQYDATEGQWLKNVFSNYGNAAMSELGQISGFKVDKMPKNVTALTQQTVKTIGQAKEGALWFEALFDAKTTTLSTQEAQELVLGSISPKQYMTDIQNSLDANK